MPVCLRPIGCKKPDSRSSDKKNKGTNTQRLACIEVERVPGPGSIDKRRVRIAKKCRNEKLEDGVSVDVCAVYAVDDCL